MKRLIPIFLLSPLLALGQQYGNNSATIQNNSVTVDSAFVQYISSETVNFNRPHLTLIDTTDQLSHGTTKGNAAHYNAIVDTNKMIFTTGDSVITFKMSGTYLITASPIFTSSAPNKTINFWERVNGVNVPNSNTIFRMLGTAQERLAFIAFQGHYNAGDEWEFVWCSTDDAGAKMEFTTKQTNPTRPTCPSIILTICKISD